MGQPCSRLQVRGGDMGKKTHTSPRITQRLLRTERKMTPLLIIFLAIGFPVIAQDQLSEKAAKKQALNDNTLLAQAAIIIPGKEIELNMTPPVVTEGEVTEEQKESPENRQFVCKASQTTVCFETGHMCAQFAQNPKSALKCWEDFYKCVTRIKGECESEFPIPAEEEDSA